ncbi:MAG TPA: heavy metal translocating P-type ATPase, partial [Cryomorphaceae bacterium]|nr:heavy metal translocating P-type ATPase [Cryomorphaceae bacterium]
MTIVIFLPNPMPDFWGMQQYTATQLECDHCHQPVIDKVIGDDGKKVYCCYGCKVVDELLLEKRSLLDPGSLPVHQYAYLDESKIRSSLLDFEEGHFARVRMHLPAIHCSSCIYLLESLPEVEESVLEVQVHFARKEATLTFRSDRLRLSQLAALLDYIGYTPDFHTRLKGSSKKRNGLLIQLGIAGFFFGNTMLLALPEYLHSSLASDPSLQNFFRYLMLLFSLPVVTFSAKDYFINAFKALRAGILSIDLPIALGVSVLFIRSVYEVFTFTGSGYFDSLSGLIFFLLIGKWYQQKTYSNFSFDRDFRSFLPLAANLVLKNGHEKPISVDDL